MSLQIFQDDPSYPQPMVEEFRQFDVPLNAIESRVQETAVLGRVQWDITDLDPHCNVAIAIRRTTNWRNYAHAGDGNLINGTANWWGEAQKQHHEIREAFPLDPNAVSTLDVFWTGTPTATGRALIAWYVEGPLDSKDPDALEAYLVYGCGNYQSALMAIPITIIKGD
jgi:hypothetical protein